MSADDLSPLPDEPLDRRVTIGLAKIGIALKQQAWAEAGGRGLTPTQGHRCWRCYGPARRSATARPGEAFLGVTAVTTRQCCRLATQGPVYKKPSAGDGRGVVVVLTPIGSREAAAAVAWPDPLLLEAVGELDCRAGHIPKCVRSSR